jgi:hypothetical protein
MPAAPDQFLVISVVIYRFSSLRLVVIGRGDVFAYVIYDRI